MHANNFKLDERYKKEVVKGAKIIAESFRIGKQRKRDKKREDKCAIDEVLKDIEGEDGGDFMNFMKSRKKKQPGKRPTPEAEKPQVEMVRGIKRAK